MKIHPPCCFGATKLPIDGSVKSPDAALHCTLRHYGVLLCTPFLRISSHPGGCSVPPLRAGTRFVRLACELFTKPSLFWTCYEIIN